MAISPPPQIVTKTVIVHDAAPAPAPVVVAANAQAPLKLQPGVGAADARYPETQIWLSTTYHPGDSRLTDIVGLAPRPNDPRSMTAAATEEKVGWVREAAGDVFHNM